MKPYLNKSSHTTKQQELLVLKLNHNLYYISNIMVEL